MNEGWLYFTKYKLYAYQKTFYNKFEPPNSNLTFNSSKLTLYRSRYSDFESLYLLFQTKKNIIFLAPLYDVISNFCIFVFLYFIFEILKFLFFSISVSELKKKKFIF